MDFGAHTPFILAAYAAFYGVLAALIAWLLYDGSRQSRALAALEARGVRRRSDAGSTPSNDGNSRR